MLRKICFLTNDNLYNSKRYFTTCLAEALEMQGVETRTLDVAETGLSENEVISINDWSPDITCSFSTITPLPDQTFFWDHLKIPHLFVLLDPAIFYMQYVKSTYAMVSCVDRDDCSFLERAHFRTSFFLPHAVDKKFLQEPLNSERPYDVVLVGSCYDHESLRKSWQENLSTLSCDVIEAAVDIVLSKPGTHFTKALVKAVNECKGNPAELNLVQLANYVDNYLRGKDRYELIRSIKDAHVHIFGKLFWDEKGRLSDWNDYFGDQENVTIHEGVPFEESFEIYKKSKICLNSTPFFKNGSHERVFNSLATGCAVIASENRYLKEQFPSGSGVVFYQHNKWEDVNDLLNRWLKNEELRASEVLVGRERVAKQHTWEHRAWQILDEVPVMIAEIYARTSMN